MFLGKEALDNGSCVVLPFICCLSFRRCDVAAEMCVTGNVRLPMMQKTKSSRRPKTDHVNLNEKIRFVPKHARDEDMLDPDAIPWLPRP